MVMNTFVTFKIEDAMKTFRYTLIPQHYNLTLFISS